MTHDVRHENGWVIFPDGLRLRAICGGGSGGGKTTVTNQIPAKDEKELELIGKQNEILDIQTQELKRQNEALIAIFPQQKELLAAQTEAAIANAQFTKEQIPFLKEQMEITRQQGALQTTLIDKAIKELEGTPEEQEIRTLSNQRALAILKGEAPPLSPAQQERINTVFGRAAEEAQSSLKTFAEELAGSRGLRVTDTPIGGEVLRQGREIASSLAAAKANAELNVGQTEQVFGENVRQFQESLRQQAFQNRLALTGRSGGGLALPAPPTMNPMFAGTTSGGALAGAQNLLGTLSADRLASGTQNSRAPGVDYTGAAIGAGGAVAGAALIGSAPYWAPALAALSTRRVKKGIIPYDQDEYDRALEKVNATPITRWKYQWEGDDQRPHTGPILEMSPDDIKLDDARLDLVSYSGLLHAALRAVDRKVARLESRLPVKADAAPRDRVARFSALVTKAA